MSIFDRLYPPRTIKRANKETTNKAQSVALWTTGGKKASFFDVNDHSTIKNGYNSNPYVYSVVNRLATLSASIPIKVQKVTDAVKYEKYKSLDPLQKVRPEYLQMKEDALQDVPDHDLQKLLDYPNSENGAYEFRFEFFVNKLVTGNGFIHALKPTDTRPPVELWGLPPLAVTLNESGNFYSKILEAYFQWGETSVTIPPENLMHSRYYNPDGDVYGLSPLSAARRALQQLNDGDEWNTALLQNGAKPEYVLIVPPGTPDADKDDLKTRFKETQMGSKNIGSEPLVLEEDYIKFESLGYTVKDMDWVDSQLSNMRKVFDVYGVSSESFNDPANKIQANKREANRSMYTDKILPDVQSFKDELERWLVPMYPEDNLILTLDLSNVEALNEEKDKVASRMKEAHYLTLNEKRKEMGKEQIDEPWADMVWLPSNLLPASGVTQMDQADSAKAVYNIQTNGVHAN